MNDKLNTLRTKIDEIDNNILELLNERMDTNYFFLG